MKEGPVWLKTQAEHAIGCANDYTRSFSNYMVSMCFMNGHIMMHLTERI